MIRWRPASRNAAVWGGHPCTLSPARRTGQTWLSACDSLTFPSADRSRYSSKHSQVSHQGSGLHQTAKTEAEKRLSSQLPYFTGNTIEGQRDVESRSLHKAREGTRRNDVRRPFRQVTIQPKDVNTDKAAATGAMLQDGGEPGGRTQNKERAKGATLSFLNQGLSRDSYKNTFFDAQGDIRGHETSETNYVIQLNEDRASDTAHRTQSQSSNSIQADSSWVGHTTHEPLHQDVEDESSSGDRFVAIEEFESFALDEEVALFQPQLNEYEPDNGKHVSVEDHRHLMSCDTIELHTQLEYHASRGHVDHVDSIISLLVYNRNERPDERHFNAMILVNADNASGNTERLKAILQDMEQASVPISTYICHSILRVLAVHPDAVLRDQVLAEMRRHWFTLSAEGWHDLVCGLVREGNFERALDKMDEMQDSGIPAQMWLKDMVIYALCDERELDYALLYLQSRASDEGNNLSLAVWYYIFDAACQDLHADAVRFIWKNCIQKDYLAPSSGQCLQVLNTAARTADYWLASDVFRVMGERGTHSQELHYELLIKTFLDVEDLESVLRIACIMAEGKVILTEASLLPLQKFLRSKRDRPRQAFSILQNFAVRNRRSPISLANCLLEATLFADGFPKAQEIHRAMPRFCSSQPNTETFNILLRGCSSDKDAATKLVRQLHAAGERPNALTYDRIMLICCRNTDYEEAFDYFLDMKDHYGWTARSGTLEEMARHFMRVGDARRLGVLLEGMKELNSSLHQRLRREAQEMGLISDDDQLRAEHSVAVAGFV